MEEAMRTVLALMCIALLTRSVLAQQRPEIQTVTIGPWAIALTYKADKFANCAMTRSADGLGVAFVRNQDGLLLVLDSPKWKLERGKAYSVRLSAGSMALEAKAFAESKAVTIAIADPPFNQKLRTANVLQVRGEGATLRVPLDGSAAAFERLELCYEKNSRESPEANPFVAPSRRP
jgi:hypothetical protein